MLAFKSLHCDEKLSVELLHLGIAPAVDASRHLLCSAPTAAKLPAAARKRFEPESQWQAWESEGQK